MYYLTINNDGDFVVQKRSEIERKGENPYSTVLTPKSIDEVYAYFAKEVERLNIDPADLRIMSSSSIDFPDEYTSKQHVLDICGALS